MTFNGDPLTRVSKGRVYRYVNGMQGARLEGAQWLAGSVERSPWGWEAITGSKTSLGARYASQAAAVAALVEYVDRRAAATREAMVTS
jgi:hypothetical protein